MRMQDDETKFANEYPYTFARVSAMRSKLLKKSDYDKILKMKEAEIAKFLQDFEYKKEINKFGVQLNGAQLIEKAIRENLTETLNKIVNISDPELQMVLKEYLKKEDYFNIKTIIRGKFTKTQNEEIRKLLVPVGELNNDALNKLISEDDIERIILKTKLSKNDEIKQAIKTFKEKKQLEILEFAIDKAFYKEMIAFVNSLSSDTKIIKDFLAGEIDATNIKIILKFKREKVGEDTIKKLLFISKASKLSRQKWEKIASAKTMADVLKEFEKTAYFDLMKKGIEELTKKDTLSEVDLLLQKFLLSRTQTKNHQNPLSIDVLLSYMFAKEVEIRNIHLIVKSKQLGLKEDFIEKQLIVGN